MLKHIFDNKPVTSVHFIYNSDREEEVEMDKKQGVEVQTVILLTMKFTVNTSETKCHDTKRSLPKTLQTNNHSIRSPWFKSEAPL